MISHFFTAPSCRVNCTFLGQSHQDSNGGEAAGPQLFYAAGIPNLRITLSHKTPAAERLSRSRQKAQGPRPFA